MQYFTQRIKSTWVLTLLLAFVMSIGGASSTRVAIQTDYSTDFSGCSSDNLPIGWSTSTNGENAGTTAWTYSSYYGYYISSWASTNSKAMITPAVSGQVTIKTAIYSGSSYTFKVYKYTENAGDYVQGDEIAISEAITTSETTISFNVDEQTHLGIIAKNIELHSFAAASAEIPEVRALSITAFSRTSAYSVTAGEGNVFDADFSVTVKNNGNVALTAEEVSVSIQNSDGSIVYATANATEALAAGSSVSIPVSATGIDAGAGGYIYFYAKENLTNTKYSNSAYISVTAYIAKFAFYYGSSQISEGTLQNYGFIKASSAGTYTIKNTGTAPLHVTSITAPEGWTVSPYADFDIAAGAQTDVTVQLNVTEGNYGRRNGDLTITHDLGTYTVPVDGVAINPDKQYFDFSDNQFPTGWTAGSNWSASNGYANQSSWNTATDLVTSNIQVEAGEKFYIEARSKGSSYDGLKISYKKSGETDWTEVLDLSDALTTTKAIYEFSIATAGTYTIQFTGKYVEIHKIYGGEQPNEPIFDFTAADYDFGIITENTSKTFTIQNLGKADLTGLTAEVTGNFTADVAASIAAKGSTDLTITAKAEAKGAQTGVVTIKVLGEEKATFNVSSFITDDSKFFENFSGNSLPNGWEVTGKAEAWSFDEGTAKSSYSSTKGYLVTPALSVEGTTDALVFQAKSTYNGSVTIKVEKSKDGQTWTACKSISLTSADKDVLKLHTIDGLEAGSYQFRFENEDYTITFINGFHLNNNAPKLSIFADEAATEAITGDVTKDFGWTTTDQTATYYIKNTGTGTLSLTLGEQPAGFTAVLGRNTLAKNEQTTLTVSMAAENNEGYHTGDITLTAADEAGSFKVTASGVVVDNEKLYVNFAGQDTDVPAGWTKNNWSVTANANGYIASGSSSNDLITGKLTVTEGEQLIISASGDVSSYYSPTTLTYSTSEDGETWSEAHDIASTLKSTSTWYTIAIKDIPATTKYVKFTGKNAYIQRIYGFKAFTQAIMTTDAADYDFGNVTEATEKVFKVKNEGSAPLTNLAAVLTTGTDYEVAVGKTTLDINEETTVTVTQKFDIEHLGAKSDVLTISADNQTDVVINLSGQTRDGSKYYAAAPTLTANKFSAPALKIAAGETITFDVKGTTMTEFSVEYTTDGGLTWQKKDDYNIAYGDNKGLSLSLGNTEEVTAWVVFNVRVATLTNVYGGTETTAPLISITKDGNAIVNDYTYDFGTLTTADATMTFTVKNEGSAALQSTVEATGDINATPATLNVAAGETQDIIVTLPYAAPYGVKTGSIVITSEGGVGTVTQKFKGRTLDETAFDQDFAAGSIPAGWYNGGWTIATDGYAQNMSETSYDLISEQLEVKTADEVLTFDAKYLSAYGNSLEVSYSTNRKEWTPTSAITLASNFQTVSIEGVPVGKYYLRFRGVWAAIDNLKGWHKTAAPEHDIYVAKSNIPNGDLTPGEQVEPTIDVAALRSNETVTAELYFGEEKVKETTVDVAVGKTETITIAANAPATEGNYDVYIKVSASGLSDETEKTTIKVAHRHELAINAFTRDGEGNIEANGENKFDATFKVTVKNNGTATENATVNIMLDDVLVGTTTLENLAANAEQEAIVNATGIHAGEGGELTFKAVAKLGETTFTTETVVTINVIAAAPKFALYKNETTVENNTVVDFGITSAAAAETYTIKNEGNAALTLNSITAPEGFTVTPELTADNKTIAVGASLDITVTMTTATGKKSGNVDIKYQVAGEEKTFTLAVKGRTVPEGTWVETFDADNMPEGWMNSGWRVSIDNSIYSSDATSTLITPRLSATKYQTLNFDIVKNNDNAELTVEISTDRQNWTTITGIASTVGEKSIQAPATGNYYIRFTGRYIYLDNFIGWKKTVVDHDLMITTSDIPATATVNNSYSATVNVKELAGKNEHVVATLYVDGQAVATSETTDINAGSTGYFTLKYTPYEATETAVKAYVEVKVADTDYSVKTAEQDLTVEAESGEYETLTGTVTDENSQPVADAIITVTATKSDGTVVKYTTTTGADGKFSVDIYQTSLSYTVKAVKGEKSVEKDINNFDEVSLMFDFSTGIRAILMEKGLDGTVYTLDGRRVENPVKGRLYIVNGKKIIFKK